MIEHESARGAEAQWRVELSCGHQIAVPAVAGALATMACVTEHQKQCRERGRPAVLDSGFAYPMAVPRGVANR
jgi:hypothetical protein